jgi:predicted metal-dependent phosphoesterase TrpH
MKIDLHVHTKTGSDGNLTVEEVFAEASKRHIDLLSITDHDSVDCQEKATALAREYGISYVTGIELNVTYKYPGTKAVSLDFLGYRYDVHNTDLLHKLRIIKERRERRAHEILDKLNAELMRENIEPLTETDIKNIEESVDGVFGRPHIANYLIQKGIVRDKQEAFDRYLVKCDVPKYPLSLAEASWSIRNAGGILVLAHPNDPNGTSLRSITRDLSEQTAIIEKHMLKYIDGIECWHSRNDEKTTDHYVAFGRTHHLIMTGGSDCHQKPIMMGTVDVPDFVASQFADQA